MSEIIESGINPNVVVHLMVNQNRFSCKILNIEILYKFSVVAVVVVVVVYLFIVCTFYYIRRSLLSSLSANFFLLQSFSSFFFLNIFIVSIVLFGTQIGCILRQQNKQFVTLFAQCYLIYQVNIKIAKQLLCLLLELLTGIFSLSLAPAFITWLQHSYIYWCCECQHHYIAK